MSGFMRKMARRQTHAAHGLLKRMARDHEDLLNSIEAALVRAFRFTDEVDDAVCHSAIEAVLSGQAPRHPLAAVLAGNLAKVRQTRPDVSDTVWQDALRVVAQSIHTHSSRQKGQTDYLLFVTAFIP